MKEIQRASAGMLQWLFARCCVAAGERAGQRSPAGLDRRSMMFSLLSVVAAPILDRKFSLNLQHPQPKPAKPSGVITGG